MDKEEEAGEMEGSHFTVYISYPKGFGLLYKKGSRMKYLRATESQLLLTAQPPFQRDLREEGE